MPRGGPWGRSDHRDDEESDPPTLIERGAERIQETIDEGRVEGLLDRMMRPGNGGNRPLYWGWGLELDEAGNPRVETFGNLRERFEGLAEGVEEPFVDWQLDPDADAVKLTARLPGVEAGDAVVSVDDRTVSIEADAGHVRHEAECTLPVDLVPDTARARLDDGRLEVEIQREPLVAARPVRIPVEDRPPPPRGTPEPARKPKRARPGAPGVSGDLAARPLVDALADRGATLALAESCTGGLAASLVTDVPGASEVLDRGLVAYTGRAKRDELGVDEALLAEAGPASEPVAAAMARGVRQAAGTAWAGATTGVAGPTRRDGDPPAGTVLVAVAGPEATTVERHAFPGDRQAVKRRGAEQLLADLRRRIEA